MKERPMLMSAPMVRATLDGSKTQTRRIVKAPQKWPQYSYCDPFCMPPAVWWWNGEHDRVGVRQECPYGLPGDRLWVRENGWQRPERTVRMLREGADTWPRYEYDADDCDHDQLREWKWKRRPSIHMPRWASRITLEITGVRVERLQKISDGDAIAEGVEPWTIGEGWREYGLTEAQELTVNFPMPTARRSFQSLWQSINGAGSWDANPWVWVIEFKRVAEGARP